NRGFFLRQANLGALLVDEQLGGRLEGVLADRENGIFTLLMLTELSPNARQEHGELERLRDVVIGAGIEAQDRVSVRSIAGEHDDRRLEARLAQSFAGLTAIHVRQPDVENDQVEMAVLCGFHAACGVSYRGDLELVVKGKLVAQGLAKVLVVIDDENLACCTHSISLPDVRML